jgi:hypothetical protein
MMIMMMIIIIVIISTLEDPAGAQGKKKTRLQREGINGKRLRGFSP